MPKATGSRAASEEAAGAPEAQIDVTPEMIEAGVFAYYENAICGWDNPGNAALRPMLREVFVAMWRKRQAKSAPTPYRHCGSNA